MKDAFVGKNLLTWFPVDDWFDLVPANSLFPKNELLSQFPSITNSKKLNMM
jgi:hypothetical protein